MIGLARGQNIGKKFNVHTKIGSGVLYLLNSGISFEVKQRGVALELVYDEIIQVRCNNKGRLEVSWKETERTCGVEFESDDAFEIVGEIAKKGIRSDLGKPPKGQDKDLP